MRVHFFVPQMMEHTAEFMSEGDHHICIDGTFYTNLQDLILLGSGPAGGAWDGPVPHMRIMLTAFTYCDAEVAKYLYSSGSCARLVSESVRRCIVLIQ